MLSCLLFESACVSKKDYERVREEDTVESYEKYLKTHENGKYTKRVLKRLEELSFEQATKDHTYSSYVAFVERFPFGTLAKEAETRAEDIRAGELGITLYRGLPEDYFRIVTATELPYRIMIRANLEKGRDRESEIRWFEEFKSREVLIPMDPRKVYRVRPDITLRLRESTVAFCSMSWALLEAEAWARDRLIKTYKIAGDRIVRYLLYEMCKDQRLYSSVFQISQREVESVARDFRHALRRLPLSGSLAMEYELRSAGDEWDHSLIQEFLDFLDAHPLCKEFCIYERGHPPTRTYTQRAFITVDPETHIPLFRISRQFPGEAEVADWSAWNSKRMLMQKDFFFSKMFLDILAALVAKGVLAY
jgi:hypothetical protein